MPFRSENRILAALPPSDIALLTPSLHSVAMPPGATPHQHELSPDYVYFPHEGLVSLLAITPDGETIEMASAGRDGAVGPFVPSDVHDSLLVALGTLRASQIATARLQILARESETLSRALETCRKALLLQVRHNLVCGGLHPVEQRLPRWLVEAANRLESEVIPATQENVAQRLGVRRTTVTLIASKLQETGAIRWGRSRVEILDRARLEAEACTCQAALRERMNALFPPASTVAQKSFGT